LNKKEKTTEELEQPLPSTSNRDTSNLDVRREGVGRDDKTGFSDVNNESTSQPDIAILKNQLRFLLPTVGTGLGSHRILSLMALDWINKELALGLDFEPLWDVELDSSNIIIFLYDCFEMSVDATVSLSQVEDLLIPAIRHFELIGGRRIPGRDRLQGIVDYILDRNPTVDWVIRYGADVGHVLASPPPHEQLLGRCRHLQQDEQSDRIEAARDKYIPTVMHWPLGFYLRLF
jgi:hypothetical protein